jgi:hypothetical protein
MILALPLLMASAIVDTSSSPSWANSGTLVSCLGVKWGSYGFGLLADGTKD